MFIRDYVTAKEHLNEQPKCTNNRLFNRQKVRSKNKRYKNNPEILNYSTVII